jgi:hypothetical protein
MAVAAHTLTTGKTQVPASVLHYAILRDEFNRSAMIRDCMIFAKSNLPY